MAAYSDRPISIYDNLNTPANNTPRPRAQSAIATSSSSSPASRAAVATSTPAASSPYTDISFRFNDNKPQQQKHPQQQQEQTASNLLPSGNRSLMPTLNQLQPTTAAATTTAIAVKPNNYTYATPFKPTTTTPSTPMLTFAPIQRPKSTSTAASPNATALTNASPAVRPLSQHSQSELNEATSQSIAAVKAALHDAKSKFFGLNGYSQNENKINSNNNFNTFETVQTPSYTNNLRGQPLLYEPNTALLHSQRPKVQILTPPPKPQPKYQNIPENSAVFRNLTPPERPPKPGHFQSSTPGQEEIPSSSPNRESPVRMAPTPAANCSSANSSPARSHTTYKQIPLNDTDCSSPSQAVYMSTTVPQNIKGSKIAGRHTPTRNSLRHSRMLVISNKNYQGQDHPNPMSFKYPNLARCLLILQVLIGAFLACLSIWIFFLAPNTAIQDNPYWSGLVLLLAGMLGLTLIRYRRIKRMRVRENCFLFLRADSYVLSLAAVLLCCVATIFAAIHFARLWASDTICESSNILLEQASCICTFNVPPPAPEADPNEVALKDDKEIWFNKKGEAKPNPMDFEDHSYKVEYRDLSCKEVTCEWTSVLGVSMSLNGLGLLVSFIYIVLLACHRNDSKRVYTSVQTSTF